MGHNEKIRRTNRKQLIFLAVFLICFGTFVAYAGSLTKNWSLLPVSFSGSDASTFHLEIASTPAERQKGLMYVKELAPDKGMMFIFPEESKRSFWMKNTYIALDMLFVDAQKKVLGILENVPVLNEEPRSVEGNSMFVIELAAGAAKAHGIKPGSSVTFGGPIPKAVPDARSAP